MFNNIHSMKSNDILFQLEIFCSNRIYISIDLCSKMYDSKIRFVRTLRIGILLIKSHDITIKETIRSMITHTINQIKVHVFFVVFRSLKCPFGQCAA